MGKRTLYIKAEDEAVWAKAEELSLPGLSISQMVATALKREVERMLEDRNIPEGLERIVFTHYDREEGLFHRVRFIGKWLVQNHLMGDQYYSVAATQKDQFLVLATLEDGTGDYEICQDYEELQDYREWNFKLDDYILSRVADYVGEDYVEFLDI